MTNSTKKQLLFLLAIVCILQLTSAWLSFTQDNLGNDDSDPLIDPDMFEGDIVITEEEFERYYGGSQADNSVFETDSQVNIQSCMYYT